MAYYNDDGGGDDGSANHESEIGGACVTEGACAPYRIKAFNPSP